MPKNEEEVFLAQVEASLLEFWEKWSIRGTEQWVVKVLREGFFILFMKSPPLVSFPIILMAYSRGLGKHLALLEEVSSLL